MSLFTHHVRNLLDCMGPPRIIKSNLIPSFGLIIFSIGSFSYNLSRFLCDKLALFIPTDYLTQDSFVKAVQEEVSVSHYFMVSYFCSLFTNISPNETIHLAVDIIVYNNQSMDITKPQLKKFFVSATL